MAEHAGVKRVKGLEIVALDEDVVGEVDEVIAGCPMHRPLTRHMLARLEDLLHHNIQRSVRSAPVIASNLVEYRPLDPVRGCLAFGLRAGALACQVEQLQPDQVLARIEHTVAVVDT